MQDREAAAMLFNSMIGKQIEQEAHMDAVSESAVTAQTHAMEKVRFHTVVLAVFTYLTLSLVRSHRFLSPPRRSRPLPRRRRLRRLPPPQRPQQ